MRKRDRRALGKYTRQIADTMELRDWTIRIDHDPCDDNLMGHAHCTSGQKEVSIAVNRAFLTYSPVDQRETIVHELIHAHTDVTWKMVQSDLADALGKPVYYVFCDSYRRANEYAVDALAKSLAKHLPLIKWP